MSSLSYRLPKTVVQESLIHGRGLFAREPIGKGEIGYIGKSCPLPVHLISQCPCDGMPQHGTAGIVSLGLGWLGLIPQKRY
jgi:hypothetical protein